MNSNHGFKAESGLDVFIRCRLTISAPDKHKDFGGKCPFVKFLINFKEKH